MKTLFKFLVLGIFLTMFGALTAFAQEDLETLFNKYKVERKKPCGERDAAVTTGKTIIEKFGADELNKDIIEYVKKDIAKIEKEDPVCKTNNAWNIAYKNKDWAKFFPLSKEIIAREGDSELGLDVMLDLVSVGYNRTALDKDDTFNNDTINYARQALQKLNSGKASKKFGIFIPFKSKENATSWMNYILGFYSNRTAGSDPAKKKEALSYFFKSTQIGTENKSDVSIYTNIGDFYFSEAAKLDEIIRAIRDSKPDPETEEGKAKLEEMKSKLALARGYADRAIDAFGRARQVATENKNGATAADAKAKAQKLIDAANKTLGDLYRFRFNLAPTAPTPELETYVSGLLSKPMPDPSTEVTPVVEEVKPATTTTTTSTTTTTPTAPTTKQPTTPTTTTTTTKQPTSTTTTKTTPASTRTTTTKTAKKPVTKKKGTR